MAFYKYIRVMFHWDPLSATEIQHVAHWAISLLEERSYIQIDNLMEMLTFCLETTYFGMESYIYRLEGGLAMRSPLSPVWANIYLKYFEEMTLGFTSLNVA